MRNENLDHLLNYRDLFQPNPLIGNFKELMDVASVYGVPEKDALLIALNASGIKNGEVKNDRGRFVLEFPDGRRFFLAMTITNQPLAPFEHRNGIISFGDRAIAKTITPIEEDTCSDSYWRGNKRHLTLNSNSRSNCKGCAFCGTYSLRDDDQALNTPDALRRKAEELCIEADRDLSTVESVGVVTGCFPGEEELVSHLKMIREVFQEFGFKNELRYIGSQLRDPNNLASLVSQGPFALYLTVESFSRRDELMKQTKASLDLDMGRDLLGIAKRLGIETTFLYIAGLDDLNTMNINFPKYQNVLSRLPLAQTFQAYVPSQLEKRNPQASRLEYFFQARKIIEESLPDLTPHISSNYRGLWYTKYGQKDLPSEEI